MAAATDPGSPLLDELAQALREEADALLAGEADRLHAACSRRVDVLARLKAELRMAPQPTRLQFAQALRAARSRHDAHAGMLAQRLAISRAQLDTLLGGAEAYLYAADGALAPRGTAAVTGTRRFA